MGIFEQLLFSYAGQINATEEVITGYYALQMYMDKPVSFYTSFIVAFSGPCICVATTTLAPTTTDYYQEPDIFLNLDSRIVYILSSLMHDLSDREIATLAANQTESVSVTLQINLTNLIYFFLSSGIFTNF